MPAARILVGDVRTRLADIPDNTIQSCITSPPYWGLRDYGHDGQIGLEQTPDEYVAEMVAVFREVRRVLKDDGVLWLNLGDSYSGSGKGPAGNLGAKHNERHLEHKHSAIVPDGLKPKDLVGIPWRVAFALQADGWYLRQDIIWHKPNPMPESVTDRCTKSHEYLFLLTKSAKYYFDNEAIKEPSAQLGKTNIRFGGSKYGDSTDPKHATKSGNEYTDNGTRNRRSVWTIPTKPFKGAHFAVMPEALVEPCILASTSEHGCCATCGSSYERIIEQGKIRERKTRDGMVGVIPGRTSTTRMNSVDMEAIPKKTIGWRKTCDCPTQDIQPSTVMDPFTGSGTVAVVSLRHGRNYIGTELNPEYVDIARERITRADPLYTQLTVE
jgi:DNA modification methylase